MTRSSFPFLLILLLFIVNVSVAQNYPRKGYDWEEGRKTTFRPTADEKRSSAVVVLDDRYYDYTANSDTNRGFDLYVTRHKIVYVNDDKGIDRFNKVYIPMDKEDQLVQLKARTIGADGKVIEVNKDNIKDVSNFEEYGSFKIFALEGVAKGAELEYFYTMKKGADIYGTEIFQSDLDVKEASFTLTSPSYLVFESKSYNGFPSAKEEVKDSLLTIFSAAKDIPAMREEQYSTSEANKMKLVYKLAYNKKASEEKLITWNTAASRYYSLIYPKDQKIAKLGKFIKDIKLGRQGPEDQVRAVERYVKTNISYKKSGSAELYDPGIVIEHKLGNEIGLARLYAAIFDELKIPVYTVMSCNRFEARFDPEFVDYSNIDEVLFYFPEYQKYLSPTRLEYRYGPAPMHLAGNYGLFIKGQYNGITKMIPLLGVDENKCLLDAELTFSEDMDAITVIKKQQWTGYRAVQIRALYEYSDIDGKNDVLKSFTTSGIEDAKVLSREVKNMTINDSGGDEPAIINTTYKAVSLIENAGKSYLLNIGKLIGIQSELYQEQERMNDIEMESPIQYKHHIWFKIPKGYKLKGLDDVNIDRAYLEDGKRVCQFVSTYTVQGDQVDINVHEFYKNNHLPKGRYEDWRRVINAASDFNKLALVLEKE